MNKLKIITSTFLLMLSSLLQSQCPIDYQVIGNGKIKFEWANSSRPTITSIIVDSDIVTGYGVGSKFWETNNTYPTNYVIQNLIVNDSVCIYTSLPVSFLYFISDKDIDGVLLKWATTSESNNVGFYVERSVDNKNWESISFIDGYGNSDNVVMYSYKDKKRTDINKYYRIKQVDISGGYKYSVVIHIRDVVKLSNNVYPNPSNGVFNIETIDVSDIKIINSIGQVIVSLHNKQGVSNVNISNMENGIYTIIIYTEFDFYKVILLKK